jgi:hypothetical protein
MLTPVQQVKAELLNAAGDHVPLPIIFTANLSLAERVAYDPSSCDLTSATDVQHAIDDLCESIGRQREPGIHITKVNTGTPGRDPMPLQNDTDVSVGRLLQGLHVVCDRPVISHMIKRPTCFVTLELPYPLNDADRALFSAFDLEPGLVGFQTIVLASKKREGIERDDARSLEIVWAPTDATRAWLDHLSDILREFGYEEQQRLLVRLLLKGNFIGDAHQPELYLDGEAFGAVDRLEDRSFIPLRSLPGGVLSGDGIPGGDFEMWFWLTPEPFMTDSETDRAVIARIATDDPRLEAVDRVWVRPAGFEELAGEPSRVDLVVGLREGAELTPEARRELTTRLTEVAGYRVNLHVATPENLNLWTSTEEPEPTLTDDLRLFSRGGP